MQFHWFRILDGRGQVYNNGANMQGNHQGAQKRLLEFNSRALYMLCACHSLNLTLFDMLDSIVKAIPLFGIVQKIYTVFASLTKTRKILIIDHVDKLTMKPLSNTQWEKLRKECQNC